MLQPLKIIGYHDIVFSHISEEKRIYRTKTSELDIVLTAEVDSEFTLGIDTEEGENIQATMDPQHDPWYASLLGKKGKYFPLFAIRAGQTDYSRVYLVEPPIIAYCDIVYSHAEGSVNIYKITSEKMIDADTLDPFFSFIEDYDNHRLDVWDNLKVCPPGGLTLYAFAVRDKEQVPSRVYIKG